MNVVLNVYAPVHHSETPPTMHVSPVGITIELQKLNGSMSPRLISIFNDLNIVLLLSYFQQRTPELWQTWMSSFVCVIRVCVGLRIKLLKYLLPLSSSVCDVAYTRKRVFVVLSAGTTTYFSWK
jgi:hypothetical protein